MSEQPDAAHVILDMENEVRTVPELGAVLVMIIDSGLRGGLTEADCKAAGRVARLLVDFADLVEAGWERAFEASAGKPRLRAA